MNDHDFMRYSRQLLLEDIAGMEKCAPASHLSDNDFANKVLATDGNKNAVREATLAKERNNQKSYQAAIDKIVCPAK